MEIKFTDNSKAIKHEFEAAVTRALEACGLTAENFAAAACAVDTGFLRNSITHALAGKAPAKKKYEASKPKNGKKGKKGKKGKGRYTGKAPDDRDGEMSVYVGTNVEYAVPVELGTSKMPAKPFLKPGVADHAAEFNQIFENELKG